MFVITTKGPEFPTGKGVVYHSQVTEYPPGWEYIARRTCGITSAAMAISLKHPDVSPLDVLLSASKLHLVPSGKVNYWLKTYLSNQEVYIPLGQNLPPDVPSHFTIVSEMPKKNPSDSYRPVFSIENGYDHRGSEALFKQYGMSAEKVGDKNKPTSPEEIAGLVQQGCTLLLSVKNSVTPWLEQYHFSGPLSHIVLLTDIVEMDGQPWYHLLDPYSPTGKEVEILRPSISFHATEFSGFGTAVNIQ